MEYSSKGNWVPIGNTLQSGDAVAIPSGTNVGAPSTDVNIGLLDKAAWIRYNTARKTLEVSPSSGSPWRPVATMDYMGSQFQIPVVASDTARMSQPGIGAVRYSELTGCLELGNGNTFDPVGQRRLEGSHTLAGTAYLTIPLPSRSVRDVWINLQRLSGLNNNAALRVSFYSDDTLLQGEYRGIHRHANGAAEPPDVMGWNMPIGHAYTYSGTLHLQVLKDDGMSTSWVLHTKLSAENSEGEWVFGEGSIDGLKNVNQVMISISPNQFGGDGWVAVSSL